MKSTFLSLFLLFFSTILLGQEVGEILVFDEMKPGENVWKTNHLTRLSNHKPNQILSPDISAFKKGKIYDKVVVKVNDVEIYFKARFREIKYGYHYFDILSDVYYEENDQLFTKANLDAYGNIKATEPIYHKNGNLWRMQVNENGSTDYQREILHNKNGEVIYIYSDLCVYHTDIEHPKYGAIRTDRWTQQAIAPNLYSSENGNSTYIGFPHIGSLHTKEGYVLTGYFHPLKENVSNATVLFLENEYTDKSYWAAIVNNRIEALQPADISEKPNILELYKNTATQIFRLNEKLNKTELKWVEESVNLQPKEKYYNGAFLNTMVTNNIETHTGYGIQLTFEDDNYYGDIKNLEVGLFKDGKLEGIGCRIKTQKAVNTGGFGYNTDKKYIIHHWSQTKINAEIGNFKNGNFDSGRTIDLPRFFSTDYNNLYAPVPYKGFYYIGEKNSNMKFIDETTKPISEMWAKTTIYSKALERQFTIVSVNRAAKTITVKSDIEGEFFDFTTEHQGDLYFWNKQTQNYTVTCDKTITRPTYKVEQVPVFSVPGGQGELESSYVKDGKTNYIYTPSRKLDTGYTVYTSKTTKSGYETVECYKCNGTGVRTIAKEVGAWLLVDFNK